MGNVQATLEIYQSGFYDVSCAAYYCVMVGWTGSSPLIVGGAVDIYPGANSVTPDGGNPGADGRGGGGGANVACTCSKGEPVNPMNGDYYDTKTDLTIPGAGIPLTFSRTYDSDGAQAEASDSAAAGALGYGWTDNLGMSVTYSSGLATVTQANGSQLTFQYYAEGATEPVGSNGVTWCPSDTTAGVFCPTSPRYIATLAGASGGTTGPWTFVNDVKSPITYSFNSSGALDEIADTTGDTLVSSTYSATTNCPSGDTCTVCPTGDTCTAWSSTPEGESTPAAVLVEAFNSSSELVKVFDAPSGASSTQVATFTYSGTGCSTWTGTPKDLCSVTDPGSLKTTFTYDTGSSSPYNYDEITMTPPQSGEVENTYTSGQITKQIIITGATNEEMDFAYSTSTAVTDGTQTTVTSYPDGTGGSSTTESYLYSNNVEVGYENGDSDWQYTDPDPTTLDPDVSIDANSNEKSQTFDNYAASGGTLTSTADVTSSTDAMGNTTLTAYTAANLPYCSVDASDVANGVTCPTTAPTTPPTTATGYTTTIYNAANEPTSVTDPLGNTTLNAYTSGISGVPNGLEYCTVAPVEVKVGVTCPAYGATHVTGTTTKTFDANGDVVTSTDPDGGTTTNVYGDAANPGLPSTTTDPVGDTTTFTYNAEGQTLTQTVTGPSGSTYSATTEYGYNSAGQKFCEVDPYEYSLGVTCPGTAPTSPPTTVKNYTDTIYNSNGQVTYVTNPIDGTTQYAYDGSGNKYCTVAPFAYAAGTRCPTTLPLTTPTPTSDPYLGATIDTFDAANQVIQETGPIGGITLTSYDPVGNIVSTTVESNNATADPNVVTTTAYNADKQATSMTNSSGTMWSEYDPDGNVYCSVSANAAAGGTSSYQCPAWQPSWITTPPAAATEYSTTPDATQANNVALNFYNADGNVTQSSNADGDTTLSAFDADGDTYCTVDPVNVAASVTCPTTPPTTPPATGSDPGYVTIIFDPAGRTLSTTNQLGDTTSTTYDLAGDKQTSTDPDGNVTTYCYYWQSAGCASTAPSAGGAGTMLYSTTTPDTAADPSGEVTTSTYYPGGTIDVATTPSGTTTTTQDAMGDSKTQTYSATGSYTAPTELQFTYNVDQSKDEMKDGTGDTTYSYDDAGDMTEQSFAAKASTHLADQVLSYTYFSTGVPETVVYPTYGSTTNPTATYTYNATGQMASVTDWASTANTVTFAYDADGNETAQNNDATTGTPSGTSSLDATYDDADEQASAQVNMVYGSAGGISPEVSGAGSGSSSGSGASSSTSEETALANDLGVANPTSVASPETHGVTADTGCTPTTLTALFDMEGGSSYGTRNPDGQITQDGDVEYDSCGGVGGFVNFGYDQAGDVTCFLSSCPYAYSYAANGDVTQMANAATSTTYTQVEDDNGEPTSQTATVGSGASSTYTYDTLGDLSSDVSTTTTSYTYNLLGQMTKLTDSAGSTAYLDNGLGLETSVKPSTASSPTQLLWEETGSLPMLASDGNDYFIYGPGETPVEQMNITTSPPSSNPTFINFIPGTGEDNYIITNTSGIYTNANSYDPYGNLSAGSPGTVFGFGGQYADTSTNSSGFDNMRARWYSPTTGNFTSVDPDLASTGQPYEYAADDPVNNTDPSGDHLRICIGFWTTSAACWGSGPYGPNSPGGEPLFSPVSTALWSYGGTSTPGEPTGVLTTALDYWGENSISTDMSVTGLSKMLGALAMIYSLTNSSPMVRMDCSGGVILCAGHWMPGFDASSCAASPASCPSAGTLEGDFQASTDETVDWLAYKYAEYGTHQQDDADIAEKFHDFFEVVTGGAGAAYVTPICGTSTSGSGTEV